MEDLLDFGVPLVNFVILLTVGLDLTLDDFRRVRHQTRVVSIGLVGPALLLPPLACGLILLLGPPPAIQTGLLLIAACPIGGISNFYSHLARASPALSVVLTGASGLLAVVTIPLLDRAFDVLLGQSLGLVAPIPLLVGQLFVMLALPIGVGMWIRRRWPDAAATSQGALRRVSLVGLSMLIALTVADDPRALARDLPSTVPLAAAFVVGSFFIGWVVTAALGATRADRFTVATEFATRNVAVAMVIAVTLAGQVEFAFFAATYFLTEVPLMLGAIWWFRRSR